jgi:hypothetical protein
MGFRFRRSIKILPGFKINLGKRGASLSVGVRGAHTTFGRSGTRTTVGIPGSGLSYSSTTRTAQATPAAVQRRSPWVSAAVLIGLVCWLVYLLRFLPNP